MQTYQNEFQRLKAVKNFVRARFPWFGVNKAQEITRLLYEISKKHGDASIFHEEKIGKNRNVPMLYAGIKKYLLSQRFPESLMVDQNIRPYLPKIELNKEEQLEIKVKKFYPKNIFVEDAVWESALAKRLRNLFPRARFSRIESLKIYECSHRGLGIKDYNKRQETVFVVSETQDFFKRCPCTKSAVGCGYHVFNLGFGCIYECTYCFLQEYTNAPGIILPANTESFFNNFSSYKRQGMRIGTGEFSDSLALDDLTGYSLSIIDFFSRHKDVRFEFKTKSNNIGNLLKSNHAGNIVVSWSLNPPKIIRENEFYSASFAQRLSAAQICAQAGYKLGFHFDPVIYFAGWEKEYKTLIIELFSKITPQDIAWVSVGTLRFVPGLKQIIEKRFSNNKILNAEMLLGYDNKLRYAYHVRFKIYKVMLKALLKYLPKPKVYLCMEEAHMWKDLGLEARRI
ncbi:MAG: hypothetical protein V1650_04225 [Candidatus Omnitrophota bacterium]